MTLDEFLRNYCIAGQNVRVFIHDGPSAICSHNFRMIVDGAPCMHLIYKDMYKKLRYLPVTKINADVINGKNTIVVNVRED